jgi:acyl carrier protein phosphodiesterase
LTNIFEHRASLTRKHESLDGNWLLNHLAHFALTDQQPLTQTGTFLGDYVKGLLKGNYIPEIERGIRLHRAIDKFTDSHPIVKQSHRLFEPEFYRYGGIMTDIIYDYMLAQSWHDYYDRQLDEYSRDTLGSLLTHKEHLPPAAYQTASRMFAHNSMAGYGNEAFIERSFDFISTRLTRANPLATAFSQFAPHRQALEADFRAFYPELIGFCDDWGRSN